MNDESLEQIQTKIAFLERANSELSDAVFRQQLEIRLLNERLERLLERVEGAQSDERQRSPEDERPPHY